MVMTSEVCHNPVCYDIDNKFGQCHIWTMVVTSHELSSLAVTSQCVMHYLHMYAIFI